LKWNLVTTVEITLPSRKGGIMLMKSIVACSLLIASSQGVPASQRPVHHFSCMLVRFYVAKYSLPAAETFARSHGATEVDIETARHCLGSSVQTASWAAISHSSAE
jgi:hypothetical protein